MVFYCQKNENFELNLANLMLLYSPLLSNEALIVYQFLNTYFRTNKMKKYNKLNERLINNFLKKSLSDFNVCLSELIDNELIDIFFLENDEYIININNIKDTALFFHNDKLASRLVNKIGQDQFDLIKLELKSDDLSNFVNANHLFLNRCKVDNQLEILNGILLNEFGLPIEKTSVLEQKIKAMTEQYNLSLNTFFTVVKNAFRVDFKKGLIKFDYNLATSILNDFFNEKHLYLKLRRDSAIFNKQNDLKNFNDIIEQYHNCDPYVFLSSIVKGPVDHQLKQIIDVIIDNNGFSYALINTIIDYLFFKSMGIPSIKYTEKLIATIKAQNLDSPIKLLQFLRRENNVKQDISLDINEFKHEKNEESFFTVRELTEISN
ncbi:DnaD domain protein [Ureaplasma canigenitalium]|uniref:DnaD domain protein n=1 Tax=Ureaplasma canigenitalium TaxID=42092 RepID=UPI0004E0B717|nr:DnaD domain protein [Ureaplasma canigenitalium]